MTTYKYVNVNAVIFFANGRVAIELRDSVVIFDSVVKGTWSKRGTVFRVSSMVVPTLRVYEAMQVASFPLRVMSWSALP